MDNLFVKKVLVNGVVVGSYESTGDNEKDLKAAQKVLKEKGLTPNVTENDGIYNQANSFATIANNIYEDGLKKSPFKGNMVAPFVVNATFCIELYLKAILNAYTFTIRGHHLFELYKEIPEEGKSIFTKAAKDLRPSYKLDTGMDIHKCLKSLSKAFEEWRYLYEKNELKTEVQSIRYTMNVSHEACCQIRGNKNVIGTVPKLP